MINKYVLGFSLAVGLSGGALAADAVVDEVVVIETAYDWSGVYVGGQAGYVFSANGQVIYEGGADFYDLDTEGGFGGVQLGYNYQFPNNFVLGVETDIVFGDINASSPWSTNPAWMGYGELKWMGSTRVRAGYAIDRWMPFATVGVAYGKYDFYDVFDPTAVSGDATLVGWTAGAGVNFAVTDNVILGAEYRFTDFGSKSFTGSNANGSLGLEADLETHDARFSISYKF